MNSESYIGFLYHEESITFDTVDVVLRYMQLKWIFILQNVPDFEHS